MALHILTVIIYLVHLCVQHVCVFMHEWVVMWVITIDFVIKQVEQESFSEKYFIWLVKLLDIWHKMSFSLQQFYVETKGNVKNLDSNLTMHYDCCISEKVK